MMGFGRSCRVNHALCMFHGIYVPKRKRKHYNSAEFLLTALLRCTLRSHIQRGPSLITVQGAGSVPLQTLLPHTAGHATALWHCLVNAVHGLLCCELP